MFRNLEAEQARFGYIYRIGELPEKVNSISNRQRTKRERR